jgi:cation:H+ antiporter
MTIAELVLSLVGILIGAVLFTNSIEILGERLGLGQGAIGSVLAAVATALPETMIPIVAILGALILGGDPSSASAKIGIGAILGAPFLLGTLALFMVGISALGFRQRRESGDEILVDKNTAMRDMVFFIVFFSLGAGVGVVAVPFFFKVALAILMVVGYIGYVVWTVKQEEEDSEEDTPENLWLWAGSGEAPTLVVVAQVLASLAGMVVGAQFFVDAVERGSEAIGIPAGLISLVLSPLATELPEKFNSIIWVGQNKDTLAMGNITGAMTFQSTIPVAIGVVFTAWSLEPISALSAALALIGGAGLFILLLRKGSLKAHYLLGGGLLYAVFLGAAIYSVVS